MKFGSYEYPTTNITHPGPNDILFGRGGGTTSHSGNIKFRKLVATHKLRYLAATKADKPSVARDVVKEWRSMDPPGRFLAKVDGSEDDSNCNSGLDDSDRGGNAVWYDVGEKKAREKASQSLRERNGVTNEAVAALVKTITASGEECPQDYETLITKAALIKAQNDITLQHHQQYQCGASDGGGGGVGHGEEIDWGDTGGGGDYRNQYSSSPAHSGSGSTSCNEDDLIEAEIQRLLKLRQQQLLNSQQKQQHQQQQLHRQRSPPSTSSGEPQAYMGEESVLREYEQLMQKQRELNMIQSKISSMGMGMGGGMNAMNFNSGSSSGGGMIMNAMSGGGVGEAGGMGGGSNNNGVQPNAAQEYMNRLRMLRQTTGIIAGVGNNNDMDQMTSSLSAHVWNNMNMVNSSNMDLGSGGMMGGGNAMQMLRQFQINNMRDGGGGGGGQGLGGGGGNTNSNTRTGQDEFTIEEYQASLQHFLSHGGGNNNKKQMRSLDVVGVDSSHRTNLDASHRTAVAGNLSDGLQKQVPTNFDYGGSNNSSGANKCNRRRSILRGSVDDSDLPNPRNTFASMMNDDKLSQSDRTSWIFNSRNTMDSIDDLGMRSTFKSVDTMDLMSIGNSINDIVDEDWEQMTPDMRAKYSRRLSLTRMSGVNNPFLNQQWGSGRGGDRPKMSNTGDNMEQYLQVQTKDCDGPTRNSRLNMDFNKSEASQLSLMLNLEGAEDDPRLSFMSNMSELTDFQDILSKQADEARR